MWEQTIQESKQGQFGQLPFSHDIIVEKERGNQ